MTRSGGDGGSDGAIPYLLVRGGLLGIGNTGLRCVLVRADQNNFGVVGVSMAFKMCAICKGGDGVCCGAGGAYVAEEEIPLIEAQTDIPIHWQQDGNLFVLTGVDGHCPLLGPEGCTIMDKPVSCYVWPWYPKADGSWLMRMTCKCWWTLTPDDFEDAKAMFKKKQRFWRNFL